jgi:hypothetical protein
MVQMVSQDVWCVTHTRKINETINEMDIFIHRTICISFMDIIPLEIPIRDQFKVLSLQLSVWIAKALYTQ